MAELSVAERQAGLDLRGVSKTFGATRAVQDVSVAVAPGEFVALLGPSGCGKSTLLRLLAGFERPDAGEIRIGPDLVSRPGYALPPEKRSIGMVFQSYALWPHMTVAENVAFALKVRRLPRAMREDRVRRTLDLVGLGDLGARKPQALSGGQRQRVALARALAVEPDVLLLDEPLANLDAHLREAMQAEFQRLHGAVASTFVYVTHDQAEAMALADRVIVMRGGRVAQADPPRRLYEEPVDADTARFVGGGMVVPAEVVGADGESRVTARILGSLVALRGTGTPGEARQACLRAEGLRLVEPDTPDTVPCTVVATTYAGALSRVTLRPATAGSDAPGDLLVAQTAGRPPRVGETVGVRIEDGWLLPAG